MKEQERWKEAFGSRHFCQTISNNVVTKFPHIEFLKKNLTTILLKRWEIFIAGYMKWLQNQL